MKVRVNIGKPYDVIVENGALDRVGALVQPLFKAGAQAMIISDSDVFPLYGERLVRSLSAAGFKVSGFVFGAGEAQKTLATVTQIYEAMAEKGFTRDDFVVTLGGGTSGDMGGFAAATFLGGIEYIQVPTSLMAQVDPPIDGEVGVDLPMGKNLVGVFRQPKLIVSDPETLATLPDEYFIDGMGEVIKYGCVMDEELFGQLERGEVIDRMKETVCRCIECKHALYETDAAVENAHAALHFGHTFGTALEKLGGTAPLSHGLSVGIGMVMAAEVGESFGITEIGTAAKIRAVLESYGLPTETEHDFSKVAEAAAQNKQTSGKQLQLVLLKQIGSTVLHPIDRSYLVLRYKIAAEQHRRKQ